jgi:hypothetical protein
MSEVVRALRDRGVTRLRLDVVAANVHAITFYRRLYAIPLVMHPTPRSSVDEMTMALHDVTLSPPGDPRHPRGADDRRPQSMTPPTEPAR